MTYDVCIIGAGAAGLMAAIRGAQLGAKVVVFESNSTVGRKLLKTGRGRCNLTHVGSISDFVKAYGSWGRFLRPALHEFSPDDVRKFFSDRRLATKVEKDGCVFPITDRATDVGRILLDVCRRENVTFLYGKKTETIENGPEGFVIKGGGKRIVSRSVIIATGGISWGHTGSKGDGYKFARRFGHKIVEPKAALVGLVTKEDWPRQMQGVGVERVNLRAVINKKRFQANGPMMFTDRGIGGPAAFDMSRLITDHLYETGKSVKVVIDMQPDVEVKDLDETIVARCAESPKKELAGVLLGILPRVLMLKICEMLEPMGNIIANQLTKQQRVKLVKLIKSISVNIKSTLPIAEATITRGGVLHTEIDPKTMESKCCKGLYFAGEVIGVDGPCGGYNLQIAWSTGALAGKSASENSIA